MEKIVEEENYILYLPDLPLWIEMWTLLMCMPCHQVMLDDAQRQLQNQEKMLQHLSKSLQDKDRQLHDYMHMIQEQRVS